MAAKKMKYCWEFMQCDEEDNCPVRVNKIERCWEWMKDQNQFQCQYGLCYECIVYLCNSEETYLTDSEIEQAMVRLGLYQSDTHIYSEKSSLE